MSELERRLRFASIHIRENGLRTDQGAKRTADLLLEAADRIEALEQEGKI